MALEDSKIVELYFERNENAVNETMKKYDNYLNAIANRSLVYREDAEECVNDTYAGAWNSIPPNKPSNLATYLGKILRRNILMHIRKYQYEKRVNPDVITSMDELEEMISDGKDYTKGIEEKELASIISRFLRKRKSHERYVFVSRYYYFNDIKTIARDTGFSEGKTKMMLKRTRDDLAIVLKKEGYL